MIKRALFVSQSFPYDLDLSVQGVIMRMRMLLSALAAETEELDLLFFVSPDHYLEGDALAGFQSDLNARWGLRANVILCAFGDRAPPRSFFGQQIAPILDARYQKRFAHNCGAETVAALEACLEREPDLIFFHRLHSMVPLFSVRRALAAGGLGF